MRKQVCIVYKMDERGTGLRPETLALTSLPLTPELIALLRAIEIVSGQGRPSTGALARAIEESPQRVTMMVTRNGKASLDCVPKIARATGFRVRCEELYPSFHWDVVFEQAAALARSVSAALPSPAV